MVNHDINTAMYKTGGWFNIKMPSYQYRKSHGGDKTNQRPSYLHNGISYTGKMTLMTLKYNKCNSRWGAVTAFLWGQRLYCEANDRNKHPVMGTTASCEEQPSFQADFLCTCEVILYKTLPIECPGIWSMRCDVTFKLTSSKIWETVATKYLQRRSCEAKLEC